MLKIRLRRMGAIRQPHYRIVVADARAPRDGAFIETLGHYNPLTNPATIQVDVAKYEEWKRKGAQPTDAVASLVKQFNRSARAGAAAETATTATDKRTRTASGKRSVPAAAAPAAPEAEVAPEAEAASPAVEEAVTDQPMGEAVAEATRDGGEESDAIISESADDATSANPGQA
ncbi:MAG: 30S ribosomal protein S16 [Chloroflexota bacterium]